MPFRSRTLRTTWPLTGTAVLLDRVEAERHLIVTDGGIELPYD